jgi:hypothetical protein
MDPFTMMAIASAVPGVMQAFQQNNTPQNSLSGQSMIPIASYQPYFNSIMANGSNPMAQTYQNASQGANAAMKNNLAGHGVLNSSAGDMALAGLNTNLANAYVGNQMNRQQQALQTVGQFQNGAMQSNLGLGQANNQQGWNTFGGNAQNNQNATGGINSILSGLSGAYGAYTKNNQQTAANNQAQSNFQQYMNYLQNQQMYMNNPNNMPVGSTYWSSAGGPQ